VTGRFGKRNKEEAESPPQLFRETRLKRTKWEDAMRARTEGQLKAFRLLGTV
jgi:hypothetical protein